MRSWTRHVVIAVVLLAAVAGAWIGPAIAQPQVGLQPAPSPGTAAPIPEGTPESAAEPPTQVLQGPSRFGPGELGQLAAILASADGASVILRVPGSATIEASEPDLRALAEAARETRFFVVQQGGARLDGAAAILSAFAHVGFRQPGSDVASGKPGELWPVVGRMTPCGRPCPPSRPTSEAPSWIDSDAPAVEADLVASDQPLTDVLDEPAPGAGGGRGVERPVVGLLILVTGGLTWVTLARARRRRRAEPRRAAATSAPTAVGAVWGRPAPTDGNPGPPAPPLPARTGRARQAKVVSVLDPEGYVELDRCLRRARWASSGALPATPGEWVDVETHGRRLWAYAAARSPAPAGRRRRPTERRHSREPL